MNTCQAFFEAMHERFPMLAEKADRLYETYWAESPADEDAYFVWFESLANAVNSDMRHGAAALQAKPVFEYIHEVFDNGSDQVKRCIDVSFVENLFWRVAPERALPYWKALPTPLKALYIQFHGRPPE
ncbi:hypothetical protein [Massilia sp. CF038]|uniref:DUF7674 family protein n=1 Tax=Massilia sp. CF038 TaxID=1881045 RepID=UPI00090F600F|nr:hypothetical protein [Massilia sp. CF038]SHG40607.1 hypothetical protein SAMN05428948_0308 [Massilia sp. CF038]